MNCSEAQGEHCPYFTSSAKECLMTNGGLYIPMPEHINALCTSSRFGQCHHYLQGCEAVRELAGQLGFVRDASRRRYRRVWERIPLQIADYGHDGRSAAILDNDACTIDLSLGGIRVESRVELPVRKKVAFVFGQNGEEACWDGQGEVLWTEKIGTVAFHSGLIVTDKKTFQALGQYLSLPWVPPL